MTLQPGVALVVAPSFHLPIDWRDRIQLGAGVDRGERGFLPRSPWRSPDDRELALLVPGGEPHLADCLCLFRLPQHLQTAWQHLLERAEEAALPGFDDFAAAVADFLAFKELPVPEGAVFDVVVSQPGLRSPHWSTPSLWGALNLGETATSLVFLNRSGAAEDESPVQLRIEPGEGVRLPAGFVGHSCALDEQEPDVWLLIRSPSA